MLEFLKKTVASHQLKYRRHSIVCIFQDISFNIISFTCISTNRKLGCIYLKFYKSAGGCHGRQVTRGNEWKRVKGQNVLTSSIMHDPFLIFIYFILRGLGERKEMWNTVIPHSKTLEPSPDITYRGLKNIIRCIIHHNIIAFLTSRFNKSGLIYLIYPIASVPEFNINNIHVYPINCWVQYERSPKLMKGNLQLLYNRC